MKSMFMVVYGKEANKCT